MYVQRPSIKPLKLYDFVNDKLIDDSSILHDRDFKLVFTNGCFDILHAGHVSYLELAKSKGDKLVVAVNSDASVRRLKGDKRPINDLAKRVKVLQGIGFVDYIVVFDDDTPYNVIKDIMPDCIVKGAPYVSRDQIVGQDLVNEIVIIKKFYDVSSSHLVEYI